MTRLSRQIVVALAALTLTFGVLAARSHASNSAEYRSFSGSETLPSELTSEQLPDMNFGSYHDVINTLSDGRLLISGSFGAEIFNPKTKKFSLISKPRVGHVAVSLGDGYDGYAGAALIVGGYGEGDYLADSEIFVKDFDESPHTFHGEEKMTEPRQWHAATAFFRDGDWDTKVLITGGKNNSGVLASAEIFDAGPVFGDFEPTGSMNQARMLHTSTRLDDERILIVGGSDGSKPLASAEIYNPATGKFKTTGSMTTPRQRHQAVKLNDGRVLVVGGWNNGVLDSAEIFDPATGTFTPTDDLLTPRAAHTATMLSNGKVLVVGGYQSGGELITAELFDPATETFSYTGAMKTARESHTATPILDGTRVLIAGGYNAKDKHLKSAELYDVASGSFVSAGSMQTARRRHVAAYAHPQGNPEVVVTGGEGKNGMLASAEVYDVNKNKFQPMLTPLGNMRTPRWLHDAFTLKDGRTLFFGGYSWWDPASDSSEPAYMEYYNDKKNEGYTVPIYGVPYAGTVVELANGNFLMSGGDFRTTIFSSAAIFNPYGETEYLIEDMGWPRTYHSMILLDDGRVLIVGGQGDSFEPLASAEIFDPRTETFNATDSMSVTREYPSSYKLSDGRVVVLGGTDTRLVEVFSSQTETFSTLGLVQTKKPIGPVFVMKNDKLLIFAREYNEDRYEVELFDTKTGQSEKMGTFKSRHSGSATTLMDDGTIFFAGYPAGAPPRVWTLSYHADLLTLKIGNRMEGTLWLPEDGVVGTSAEIDVMASSSDAPVVAASLSNDGKSWGNWFDIQPNQRKTVNWHFGGAGNNKTVYLRVKDANGRTAEVVSGVVDVGVEPTVTPTGTLPTATPTPTETPTLPPDVTPSPTATLAPGEPTPTPQPTASATPDIVRNEHIYLPMLLRSP